jgi:hypothetical protein
VETHAFLSPSWIAAARDIRDEYAGSAEPPDDPVRANVIITDAPFGEGTILGFVDTSSGHLVIEEGELDNADLTLSTDYGTAKSMFVDRDPQAAMQALFAGKVRAEGDVMRLMSLQNSGPVDPEAKRLAKEIAAKVDAMTSTDL